MSCRSCPFHENSRSVWDRDIPLDMVIISSSEYACKCFWVKYYPFFLKIDILDYEQIGGTENAPAVAGAFRWTA